MAFSSDELHGANAMMPAFAKPGSTSLTATDTVNVDELTKAVDRIINDGVNVISAMGSYGECHTLLWEEFQTLTEATIQAVNKRVPLFIGVTSLNGREVVHKVKFAQSVGAEGIFVGVPHYYPPSVNNAIEFYREIGEMFPHLSIQVYHNPPLHHIHIPVRALREITKNPRVVSMKDSHRTPLEFIKLMDIVRGKMSIFTNQSQYYPFHDYGAAGFWSTDIWMGPWPLLQLRDCVDAGDIEGAKEVYSWLVPGDGGQHEFGGAEDNARKLAASSTGYADQGPNRSPFMIVRPESLEKAMKRAAIWKEKNDQYRPLVEARHREPALARYLAWTSPKSKTNLGSTSGSPREISAATGTRSGIVKSSSRSSGAGPISTMA